MSSLKKKNLGIKSGEKLQTKYSNVQAYHEVYNEDVNKVGANLRAELF